MTVTEYIRQHLLDTVGYREILWLPSPDKVRQIEWSTEFETAMRNRLLLGSIRYGKLGDADKPEYSRVEAMHRKLVEYTQTGNLECLVDNSNLSLCEFVESTHPKKHFHSVGVDQTHVERR